MIIDEGKLVEEEIENESTNYLVGGPECGIFWGREAEIIGKRVRGG